MTTGMTPLITSIPASEQRSEAWHEVKTRLRTKVGNFDTANCRNGPNIVRSCNGENGKIKNVNNSDGAKRSLHELTSVEDAEHQNRHSLL